MCIHSFFLILVSLPKKMALNISFVVFTILICVIYSIFHTTHIFDFIENIINHLFLYLISYNILH